MLDKTVRYEELDLVDRLRLIGKTVMVGLYTKSADEEEDLEDEYIGSVTGTLSAISDASHTVVFNFVGGDENGDVRASTGTQALLITWLD